MLGKLNDVFSTVSILILSATITLKILDYVRVFLKLSPASLIYRLFLNRLNLKYIVCIIWKSDFLDLAILIPKNGSISGILKTMVFGDKIEDFIELEKYL